LLQLPWKQKRGDLIFFLFLSSNFMKLCRNIHRIPTRFHKVWLRDLREMCWTNFWRKKERRRRRRIITSIRIQIIAGYSPNRNWWNLIGTTSTSSGTR
jgi:hypothetical protein